MMMNSVKLALCVRILRDTCQAASCDVAGQNDGVKQFYCADLFVEDDCQQQQMEIVSQEIAAISQGGRHDDYHSQVQTDHGSRCVPPGFPRKAR